MEAFGIYLLKVSALMGIFYLAYFVYLRKETFFNSNRWFLLAGLITSLALPFVTYTKIVWVDPAPVYDYSTLALPANYVPVQEPTFEIDWFLVLATVYGIGILVFLVKFAIDCFAIKQIIEKPKAIKKSDFYLIDTEKVQSPFSFFNYIVYNSALLKEEELENILHHEKVHSAQKHSLDMLVAQIFCIAFWFNPIVWLYKKAIAQNLEFIADAEATKKIEDVKSYQKTLLKVTMQSQCIAITNPFYQSLIKKRIVMLNKNQSDKKNSWKYLVVLPLLAFFMFQFQTRVLAQEKTNPVAEKSQESKKVVSVVIDKNTTDAEIKKDAEMLKNDFAITLKVSKIKRNSSGEITGLKIKVKDNEGNSADSQYNSKTPIQPIQIVKEFGGDKFFGIGTKDFFRKQKSDLVQVKRIKHISEDGEKDIQVIVDGDDHDFEWTNDFDFDHPSPPSPPDAPDFEGVPSPPDAPKAPRAPKIMKKTVVVKQNGNKKEVWVDGEKVTEEFAYAMDPNDIESVNVYSTKGPKGPKGEKGDKVMFTDQEVEVIHDGDKKIVIVTKGKDGKTKRTVETIDIKKITDETKAEIERIRPEIEKAKKEAMEARKEAMKHREEVLKAREKALEEREKALEEAEKAKEAAKARK
ncbi:hypothetical protein FEDK69T_28650 [Flavobacterium enshiense DK69]|uniref:Peptidase M56 domain-containing protein n=1 Tax=Flavobacterium enshiense DK69 TaxID=1107311 RepID=V6S102_9FLAO|nr:M56 family metallopeptidase [Flavobacterium enshiense]ESU20348.1 hypothetical protein FEDK69T_28650 [Flavobacterium enshiense DK69]KGO95842.1 hypothetical protein Q767_09140 [Flavobacterium enshiense DK69]